jgi:hypothetical protein
MCHAFPSFLLRYSALARLVKPPLQYFLKVGRQTGKAGTTHFLSSLPYRFFVFTAIFFSFNFFLVFAVCCLFLNS